MITQLFLDLLFGLAGSLTALVPSFDPPGWVTDSDGYLATVWAAGSGLGAWVPWTLAGTVFACVLASVLVGLTIKLVRIVASYLTLGGGSAG